MRVTNHTFETCRVDENGYVVVPITPEIISFCKIRAQKLGALKNSILNGGGNLAGYIGQEIVLRSIKAMNREDTYDYDLTYLPSPLTVRVEVKTKDRTVPPKPHYECSIGDANHTQQTHYYVFVSLLRKGDVYTDAYILGYIRAQEYFQNSRFMRAGELDPSNNFTVRADCHNLPISKLIPIFFH
jgi:hypothetical protein